MGLRGVLRCGSGPGDGRAHPDECRAVGLSRCCRERGIERLAINVAVRQAVDAVGGPAICLVPRDDVLGEGHGSVALDGDVIVVPDDAQSVELLHAREG